MNEHQTSFFQTQYINYTSLGCSNQQTEACLSPLFPSPPQKVPITSYSISSNCSKFLKFIHYSTSEITTLSDLISHYISQNMIVNSTHLQYALLIHYKIVHNYETIINDLNLTIHTQIEIIFLLNGGAKSSSYSSSDSSISRSTFSSDDCSIHLDHLIYSNITSPVSQLTVPLFNTIPSRTPSPLRHPADFFDESTSTSAHTSPNIPLDSPFQQFSNQKLRLKPMEPPFRIQITPKYLM